MTNNPTIDGVSRELLERILAWLHTDEPDDGGWIAELRALIDAPAVERQEHKAPFYISLDDWNLLVRGDVEIASVRVSRTRRSKFTEPLFARHADVAALQSTIAQLEDKLNKAIDLDFKRRETIEQLQARIAELESGRGEVARYERWYQGTWFEVAQGDVERFEKDGWKIRKLYTAPPEPVAVVLPDRMPKYDALEHPSYMRGWNAFLDATAALNEVKK